MSNFIIGFLIGIGAMAVIGIVADIIFGLVEANCRRKYNDSVWFYFEEEERK